MDYFGLNSIGDLPKLKELQPQDNSIGNPEGEGVSPALPEISHNGNANVPEVPEVPEVPDVPELVIPEGGAAMPDMEPKEASAADDDETPAEPEDEMQDEAKDTTDPDIDPEEKQDQD